jgi:CheY-like chemotaxis protein
MDYIHTLLLVDDELEIQKLTIMVLEDSGYNVITANNGVTAIEILKNQHVDILLIDYFMSPMNGEETIKEIRKFNTEILIIMQTAFSGEKPVYTMLHDLDIQNYYDKSQGVEGLLLMITAASKTVELMYKVKDSYEVISVENKKFKSYKEVFNLLSKNTNIIEESIEHIKNKLNVEPNYSDLDKYVENIYIKNKLNRELLISLMDNPNIIGIDQLLEKDFVVGKL